jgi:hypothetical protein
MNINNRILTCIIGSALTLIFSACNDSGKREMDGGNSNNDSTQLSERSINTEYETPMKLKDYVTGDWVIDENSGGEEKNTLRVTFTRDGKYNRYTGNQQTESGLYRVNEQHKFLYLEADGGGKPAEWDVTIDDQNQMTLKLRDGSAHGESYNFTYTRQK